MADPNPLFDDLGLDRNPAAEAASDNPLMSDLGIQKNKAEPTTEADPDASPPDSDEWNKMGLLQKNVAVAKAAPRWLAEGAGQLMDTGTDLVENAFSNDVASPKDRDQESHPFFEKIAHVIADRLGLPKTPDSRAGRIIGAGVKALPSAIVGGPEGAAESLLPTAASGAASQTAAEAGGGPIAQVAAGLLPFAAHGGAASIRGAVRGGPAGGEAMRQSLEDADAAGLKLSVGHASGNPIIKGAEALSSRLPGGGPLAETRNMNAQVEHSVSEIQKTINPNYDENPHTPREAGAEIEEGAKKSIERGKVETGAAAKEMNEAVGGEDTPMSAPRSRAAVESITKPTGIPEVDDAITKSKTKAAANVIKSVSDTPKIATSYSTDGQGYHSIKSPNGETHITEQASGNLKVTRDDTHPDFQGKGEGTARLATAAHIATSKGVALESDVSVSPHEAKAFEGLAKKGWQVDKNPKAEIYPSGNTVSDSPKSPVYTVSAPSTRVTPSIPAAEPNGPGTEFSYDPKTGESTPGQIQSPQDSGSPMKLEASLNPETPWTFKSFRALRTNVGKALKTATGTEQIQLATLYGHMSEDLKDFVKSKGPDAEHKYELFNSVAKTNGDQREALEKAIENEGGPGEIFRKAMSGNQDDAGKISRVMGAMDEGGKNTFRSVVLHRMGRVAGAQTGPFSADTFLKNWDKMSQEAKNTIFGSSKSTSQLRTSLDALTKSLTDMKAGGMLKSGLGTELQRAGTSLGHGVGLLATVTALAEFGKPVAHLIGGHPLMAAGSATATGAALLANPVLSRALTNPKIVTWLAQATKAPKGMAPVLMAQLGRMGDKDSDAKDLSDLIQGTGQSAQAEPPPKPQETGVRTTTYPKINRSAGMQPLPGGGYGIPPESF